jgi:hypothetical protein
MQFIVGDQTDGALCAVLAHEFLLCTESFERFAHFGKLNILGKRDKRTKISSHNAYARFLHHLYEFYVGCWKRDRHDTSDIHYTMRDKMFNAEVAKLLRNRIDAIKGGYAPVWENHISAYQVDVPSNFGEQFRQVRNRTAHSNIKRSASGTDLSLAKFYEACHPFVYLLYYAGQGMWTVKDIEAYDWKEIEQFDLAVQG